MPEFEDRIPFNQVSSPALRRLLVQTAMWNRSALNDPLVADNVRPLQPFFSILVNQLLDPDSDYLRFPGLLGEQLELFTFALQQRLEGSHYTIRRAGATFASYGGGWQRILECYDHVARSVLQSSGITWQGFVVIGFSPEYHRFYGGIVNLPPEAIHPENAWGLFHELGHEWGAVRNITCKPAILSAIQQLGRPDLDHFVWEVASEAFAWFYGFGEANWDLCSELTWKYLSQFSRTFLHPEVYLARWLVADSVRIYVRENKQPGYDELRGKALHLRQRLRELNPNIHLSDDGLRAAVALATNLRGVVSAIAQEVVTHPGGDVPCEPAKELLSFLESPTGHSNQREVSFFLEQWYGALVAERVPGKELN